jgi:hypothetical protein
VDRQKADVLAVVVEQTQKVVNDYVPTANDPVPPKIERKKAPVDARDFEYSISFEPAPMAPEGEGAVARIVLYYRGNALDPVVRIYQRTVFTEAARKELLSYEMDKKADARAAKAKGDDKKR